jgi:hypothetical protein
MVWLTFCLDDLSTTSGGFHRYFPPSNQISIPNLPFAAKGTRKPHTKTEMGHPDISCVPGAFRKTGSIIAIIDGGLTMRIA